MKVYLWPFDTSMAPLLVVSLILAVPFLSNSSRLQMIMLTFFVVNFLMANFNIQNTFASSKMQIKMAVFLVINILMATLNLETLVNYALSHIGFSSDSVVAEYRSEHMQFNRVKYMGFMGMLGTLLMFAVYSVLAYNIGREYGRNELFAKLVYLKPEESALFIEIAKKRQDNRGTTFEDVEEDAEDPMDQLDEEGKKLPDEEQGALPYWEPSLK